MRFSFLMYNGCGISGDRRRARYDFTGFEETMKQLVILFGLTLAGPAV